MELTELRAMSLESLQEFVERMKIRNGTQLGREDLLRAIMGQLSQANELSVSEGLMSPLHKSSASACGTAMC